MRAITRLLEAADALAARQGLLAQGGASEPWSVQRSTFNVQHSTLNVERLLLLIAGLLLAQLNCLSTPLPVVADAKAVTTNQLQLIDLPTALRLAGARNLDIQIARERLAEAHANYESSLWRFFPWLAPGVSYRRHDDLIQDIAGNIINVHKDSYTVGPTLSAQVDLGDAFYKKLAARQLVKAADYAVEAQRQDAVLAAAQSYFDLARAQSGVAVAREAVRISTNYAGQVEQALGAGIAFKGDLLRVQVQAERDRLTLRQRQEQQRLAGTRLAQVLHLDSAVELAAPEGELFPLELVSTNASLGTLVAQARAARPELKLNRAQIQAAQDAKRGAVYGPAIPSLGAQVFAGGLGGGREGSSGTFGASEDYVVTLGWRLGPGGLFDQGRIHATEARLRATQLGADKLLDEITRQVIDSLTRAQSQADQLATARLAIQEAQETLRLTQERKQFAVGAVLESIQAEQELTRARLDYLDAVSEFNKAQYALRRAIGDLPSTGAAPGSKEGGSP